jgi:hypothetical protein
MPGSAAPDDAGGRRFVCANTSTSGTVLSGREGTRATGYRKRPGRDPNLFHGEQVHSSTGHGVVERCRSASVRYRAGMLFKRALWAGLADRTVTLAYRRWRRPQVRPQGCYRTPAGVLAVDAVEVVDPAGISEADARRAGAAGRAELLRELDRHGDGPVYRVAFHLAGPDPREALRRADDLSGDQLAELSARLARLDRASRHGPWTLQTLRLIGDRPQVRAADLAASVGRDKPSFKLDVRKLKELGLTESLEVGYRLSPRGRAVLDRLGR